MAWCKAQGMQSERCDIVRDLYRKAVFIRFFEEALAKAGDRGDVPGILHLCCGAEVMEAILCRALDAKRDQVTGSHRSHGLALLMGAPADAVAKEILGRVGGLSNGMGGTQHLIAPEHGFLTSNGIVGAQVPLGLGAALTAKTKGNGSIGVAVFGDGAANQGAVLESLNLATALSLPMVFFMENNGIAQSTSTQTSMPKSSMAQRAKAFGLPTYELEPDDFEGALTTIANAVAEARTGQPVFIEAGTARLTGHYYGDTSDETRTVSDPLKNLRSHLLRLGCKEQEIIDIENASAEQAAAAIQAAAAALRAGETEMKTASLSNSEVSA